jgi:hypothetical protein
MARGIRNFAGDEAKLPSRWFARVCKVISQDYDELIVASNKTNLKPRRSMGDIINRTLVIISSF